MADEITSLPYACAPKEHLHYTNIALNTNTYTFSCIYIAIHVAIIFNKNSCLPYIYIHV